MKDFVCRTMFVIAVLFGVHSLSGCSNDKDVVSLHNADIRVVVTKRKQFFSASVEGEPVIICNNLRVSKTALDPVGISSAQYPVRYDVKATGEMDYKANTLFARTCYLK